MDHDATITRTLEGVFRGLFSDPTLELRDGLSARDVPGWDSLQHVTLMLQVEEEFNVRFSNDEISSLKNVGELKTLIRRKLEGSE